MISLLVGNGLAFPAMSRVIGEAAVAASNANRLKAWWLYRMIFSPDPLRERLALLWHNYFATSNLKVNDVASMRQQNEIFREYAKSCSSQFGSTPYASSNAPAGRRPR